MEKACGKCKVIKPLDEFYVAKKGPQGRSSYCKPCQKQAIKNWGDRNPERRYEITKRWQTKNRPRLQELCRNYYHKNKGKYRAYESKNRVRVSVNVRCKKFGITAEQYWMMFAEQEGKCAICRKSPKKCWWSLNLDHCHETGKIRGLLCGPCNKALGSFGDTVAGVKRAVDYLNSSMTSDKGAIGENTRLTRQAWLLQTMATSEERDKAWLATARKPDPRYVHKKPDENELTEEDVKFLESWKKADDTDPVIPSFPLTELDEAT